MPVYEGAHDVKVRASPEEAFAVMTDFERLPEWQGPLVECEVLSRYEDGLARDVRYELDVRIRRVAYTLRHSYERPSRIASEYLDGDFRCLDGEWRFEPDGRGTRVRFELRIDPGLPIPGPVARMLRNRVLRSSVEDLKKRLEEG